MGEREKSLSRGSPAAAEIKRLGKRKSSRNCPGCPYVFLSIISEKVIIFDMLHYILNIAMENVT